jgi:pimeloyl-ACP methyl ester carboxylesterase
VKINGLELNVNTIGAGIPLIWGHGLTLSMAVEDKVSGGIQWEKLANEARIVRYDARGHGLSEVSDAAQDYHWSNLAQDMLALADSFGFESFIASGQSMGCATSIYAALAAPERIKALVLVTPPTAWETRAAQADFYDKEADLIEAHGIEGLITMMMQTPVAVTWQMQAYPDMGPAYLAGLRTFNPKALTQILRGAKLCDLPERAELKAITMPTLILAWTDDPAHPVFSAEEIASLVPNAQISIAQNADDAARWTQQIHDFITNLP